ncbi:MAG: hypothetical protein ACLUNZ_06610 [Evtepia sp.]
MDAKRNSRKRKNTVRPCERACSSGSPAGRPASTCIWTTAWSGACKTKLPEKERVIPFTDVKDVIYTPATPSRMASLQLITKQMPDVKRSYWYAYENNLIVVHPNNEKLAKNIRAYILNPKGSDVVPPGVSQPLEEEKQRRREEAEAKEKAAQEEREKAKAEKAAAEQAEPRPETEIEEPKEKEAE